MQTVKWGIIGCGDVCEIKSGPALQQAVGSRLVAVMRRDANLAADFARRHDVPFSSGDAAEIINHPDVNAVYVATPPESHEDYALQVAAAGKPCYVEKPMARSATECRRMCEAFEKVNVPLYVAFYRRGMTRFQTAKRLIESGELGTITGVCYRLYLPRDEKLDAADLPWRLRAEIAGAGLFYDLGSHLLDAFDYIFGPLKNVRGVAANLATPQIAVEDSVAMSFTAMGAPAVAQWNFAAPRNLDAIEIYGDKAKLSMSCFGGDDIVVESKRRRAKVRWRRATTSAVGFGANHRRRTARAGQLRFRRAAARFAQWKRWTRFWRIITAGAPTNSGSARTVGQEDRSNNFRTRVRSSAARRVSVAFALPHSASIIGTRLAALLRTLVRASEKSWRHKLFRRARS